MFGSNVCQTGKNQIVGSVLLLYCSTDGISHVSELPYTVNKIDNVEGIQNILHDAKKQLKCVIYVNHTVHTRAYPKYSALVPPSIQLLW
jgi:hypothetical protein